MSVSPSHRLRLRLAYLRERLSGECHDAQRAYQQLGLGEVVISADGQQALITAGEIRGIKCALELLDEPACGYPVAAGDQFDGSAKPYQRDADIIEGAFAREGKLSPDDIADLAADGLDVDENGAGAVEEDEPVPWRVWADSAGTRGTLFGTHLCRSARDAAEWLTPRNTLGVVVLVRHPDGREFRVEVTRRVQVMSRLLPSEGAK